MNVGEVELYLRDEDNTFCFLINKALTNGQYIRNFNMPSQLLSKRSQPKEEWAYLQQLKLANTDRSDVTAVVGADVPEAFMQLDIRKGMDS